MDGSKRLITVFLSIGRALKFVTLRVRRPLAARNIERHVPENSLGLDILPSNSFLEVFEFAFDGLTLPLPYSNLWIVQKDNELEYAVKYMV